MGAVNFSIDTSLIAALKHALPLSVFVETGTFEGETIRRARPFFESIVKKLYSLSSSHELMVINDVIIYFPASVKPAVIAYAHDYSVDWLTIADKSRDYDVLLSHLEEKEDQIKLLTDTAASRLEL